MQDWGKNQAQTAVGLSAPTRAARFRRWPKDQAPRNKAREYWALHLATGQREQKSPVIA